MSTPGETLYHPINGTPENTWEGFSWPAFLFGAFWLVAKGLWSQFIMSLLLIIVSGGWAAPVLWILLGIAGNGIHKTSILKKGFFTKAQYDERYGSTTARNTERAAVGITSAPPKDMIDRLKDISDLRDRGALTESEFADQKARLMQSK